MDAVISHVIAWPTLGFALLVFGFAPGAVLRLIVLLYPRDHPRRRELLGELYACPRIERPFWVAEQLGTALFEGLPGRFAARRAKRLVHALVFISNPGDQAITTEEVWLTAALQRADVQPDRLRRGIFQAMAKHHHVLHCANHPVRRESDLPEGSVLVPRADHCVDGDAPPQDQQEDGVRVWVRWLPKSYHRGSRRPLRCFR
jgi:hypothetical protein